MRRTTGAQENKFELSYLIFNERKLVLGLALVMLCYVSETKKVSKQFDLA